LGLVRGDDYETPMLHGKMNWAKIGPY
jgi:hypothetical protein